MDTILLYKKLASLPEHLKAEVGDFIDFLSAKANKQEKGRPVFGSGKGMFVIKPGFDDPINDLNDYMH